ncbi:MAG: LpqB family beta-propeller domain-containing protein [Acidimicrobiia bacterium]|nr:LpqB family beta-propeller domain-containing protein [Acidimicrobiia bacterium]
MTLRRRRLEATLVASLALVIFAISPADSSTENGTDVALDRAVIRALDASGADSVSAAVLYPDGHSWAGAAGIVDTRTHRRAAPSVPYAVASITKMFVATVAMQLVDDGVLALDEPVPRWIPQLRGADRITLRQLLGHTSGLAETPPVDDLSYHWTPDESFAHVPEPQCEPGACFAYVDTNYVATGQVIAAATGQPIEAEVRERILEPLHLDHTWLQGFERARGNVAPAQLANQSFDDPEGNAPSTEFVTRIGAAGALAATSSDLATFGDALFRGRIVGTEALSTMTDVAPSTPLPCPDEHRCPPAYGLGVSVEVLKGWRTWGHSGSTGSLVAYFPEQQVTVAVVTNGGGDPYAAATEIAAATPSLPTRSDLFTVDADGTRARRIPHTHGERSGAAVSPDGTKLAFTRSVGPKAELVVARIDGSDPQVVVDGLPEPGNPAWSPDGTRLAFASFRKDGPRIYVVDADGAHRRLVARGAERGAGPRFSPDGSLLAYHVYLGNDMEIRLIRPDGTGMRSVVSVPIRGRWMGYARWSPDGTRLAFTGADGGDTDVQVVALDGSNLVTLTADHVPEAEVAWSPDGRIAFSRLADIFVMDPDTPDALQQVTDTPSDEWGLDWLPDGRRIVYTGRR